MFDFKMLNDWANEQEPVFIVGPERSGTSMIFRAIVSHPTFCSFEKATVETFCFVRPFSLFDNKSPDNYEMRMYLGNEYDNFVEAVSPLLEINKICNQVGLSKGIFIKNRTVVWNRRNYRELIRTFFYFSWLNLGRNRIAEKTPAHIRAVEQIIDCFPMAKIIICVRDPLEIIASHRKRYEKEVGLGKSKDDPSLFWLNKSAEHYMRYFEHIDNLMDRFISIHSNNVFCAPYKKITKESSFIEDVFKFIGEDIGLNDFVFENSADKSLAWDPLLASSPVSNEIDLSKWLSEDDIKYMGSEGGLIRERLHGWCL